ncbi:DNA-binding protein [candidate division WOR-3 bacterium JGI_Cruoil_03_44_89]|uniref:DNA-binding protein n=1 Tax=candidate division WOR-3 bacterium JGI_Cruoil_03_44_89 TaxID=1973748 RepID=A0A235BWA6_UNCW3|nr:MAG: DNA-binding protein [candidate division WOR-3 bacterium JGI_Cruoil_03_44_89]
MLDRDLAELYGVPTKRLNEQVKRNKKRFPKDFMFQLNKEEFDILKSHFATSSWVGVRKLPNAFTENGVAMLSSVLNSDTAIQVNIQIMRVFNKMREMAIGYAELKRRIDQLEERYDKHFKIIFDAIKKLISPPKKPIKKIGFLSERK